MLNNKITFGELFCGPGGMSHGAKETKVTSFGEEYSFQHKWALDNDSDSCETYKNNINPDRIIHDDIREFNKKLKNNIEHLQKVDAIGFGFPCNDFSNLGEKNGLLGKYGPLYKEALKIVDYVNPKFFVAENVTGIKSADRGNSFEIIKRDMELKGRYRVYSHLYHFEKYGIPQKRHRYILVGIREDFKFNYSPPAPTTPQEHDYISSRSVIENIPKNAPNHDYYQTSFIVEQRLRNIKPGFNAFNSEIPKEYSLNVKGAKLSNIYRRLHPDKPSYTVTGSGGGGTKMYHWKDPRPLTNRERARLQTFPDNYIFHGKPESVRKQIGMAVPPKAAKIVFTSIIKTFINQGYSSIMSNDAQPLELFA